MTLRQAIITAAEKGYRVDDRGRVLGPTGRPRKLRAKQHKRKHPGYLYVTVRVAGKSLSIPVHRLAAYQRYGQKLFAPGVEVLHRGDNCFDNRPSVLFLGSRVENERDKRRCVNGAR